MRKLFASLFGGGAVLAAPAAHAALPAAIVAHAATPRAVAGYDLLEPEAEAPRFESQGLLGDAKQAFRAAFDVGYSEEYALARGLEAVAYGLQVAAASDSDRVSRKAARKASRALLLIASRGPLF